MDPTAPQLRAARAWLGWSLMEAGEASGVHFQTIAKLERGASKGARETVRALMRAYYDHGIACDANVIYLDPEKFEGEVAED